MTQPLDLKMGIYRRIYSGAVTGRKINSVSILEEFCFWRLHMITDDYGNFVADVDLLMCAAFPLRQNVVDQLPAWLENLAAAGLIALYEVNGDTYGHVVDFLKRQGKPRNGRLIRRTEEPPWDDLTDADIPPEAFAPGGLRNPQVSPCMGPGNPGASGGPEPEPEPEPHTHTHSEPELEHVRDESQNHSEEPTEAKQKKSSVEGRTGTGSNGRHLTRAHGRCAFDAALVPLLGLENGSRQPPKSAKYNRDLVSMSAWWDERVWPDGEDEAGQVRLAKVLQAAKKAPTVSENPMAYMADYTKRLAYG